MPSESYKSIGALCRNIGALVEPELVEKLKAILTASPDVVNETNMDGHTLLHIAAWYRSIEFCSVLIEKNPQAVRTTDYNGRLPFHHSCSDNNLETVEYLFNLYPGSIHIPDGYGSYPIHLVCSGGGEIDEMFEVARFLLQHDQGAVLIPDEEGYLPLHIACEDGELAIAVLVFNAYPEAIFIRATGGTEQTPLDIARSLHNRVVESFLETQLEFIRQAREDTVQDNEGNLPIHRALRSEYVPVVGTIKLMLASNPACTRMANNLEMIPLHIACQSGNLDIVKCLVEANEDSFQLHDMKGNTALHIACLAGKTDVITYILNKSDHGVSMQNADGSLPIQLLLFHAKCNRDSLEYIDSVDSLLRAYPAVVTFLGVSERMYNKRKAEKAGLL